MSNLYFIYIHKQHTQSFYENHPRFRGSPQAEAIPAIEECLRQGLDIKHIQQHILEKQNVVLILRDLHNLVKLAKKKMVCVFLYARWHITSRFISQRQEGVSCYKPYKGLIQSAVPDYQMQVDCTTTSATAAADANNISTNPDLVDIEGITALFDSTRAPSIELVVDPNELLMGIFLQVCLWQ